MHVKFKESNPFVKNVIDTQIEITGEEFENISIKDTSTEKVDEENEQIKEYKDNNKKKPNNSQKI